MSLLSAPKTASSRRGFVAAALIGCVWPIALVGGPAEAGTTSKSEVQVLTLARSENREAVRIVELLRAHSDRLAASAQMATNEAARLRAAVEKEDGGGLGSVAGRVFGGGDSLVTRAADAADNAAHLATLAANAEGALREAILDSERARATYEEVLTEQAHRQDSWSAADAAEFAVSLAQPADEYRVDDRKQDALNSEALSRWASYLHELSAEGVVPPPARLIDDPARLPKVRNDDGTNLTVLSAETVRAVSTAFSRLGLAGRPPLGSSADFACGGLVADAWATTDQFPADSVAQWRTLATVPASAVQVGDIVVFGDKRNGLEEAAVYVGDSQVIVADPLTGTASVQPFVPDRVYGVKRVGVPVDRTYDAPPAGLCGRPAPVVETRVATAFELQLPVKADAYRISAGFGMGGSMWASTHTGQDFAAPIGTPVAAVADGVVTVENRPWAGRLVRIDHGGGVETWYAHLSDLDVVAGQQVAKGQKIGAVGNEGNSTGPHLHLEVRLDGRAVDPSLVLRIPEAPRAAQSQGDLAVQLLCSTSMGSGHALECDAAVSMRLMSAAFADKFGANLCIADAYRPLSDRVADAPKNPGASASLHGLGRAVDLCGGAERFDTPEHRWLATHAASYGWTNPTWAAAGGSQPEPWHFEFSAVDTAT